MPDVEYHGPVIDSHTHLWDLDADKHPWLRPAADAGPLDRFAALRGKSYLLDDFRRDIEGEEVVASVHVEAVWDPADDKINETRWLETLDKSDNLASRYVAGATFGTPHTEADLRAQAAYPPVKGVRQIVSWTPDPARRMAAEPDIARQPQWLSSIPLLVELGLALELLMTPYQAEDVAALAGDFPDLRIIVNHIGSPIEQDPHGVALWRDGMKLLAQHANVTCKMSAAASYARVKSPEGMRPFVNFLVDRFGADRVMYGSDFPVGRLVGWSYSTYLDAYRSCLRDRSSAEQEAIFWRTANDVYDFQLDR